MQLYIRNDAVCADGHAGEKDGVIHAGGDNPGSRTDEKYHAVWYVPVACQPGGGIRDGGSARSTDPDAVHPGDSGTVGAGLTDGADRKYPGA